MSEDGARSRREISYLTRALKVLTVRDNVDPARERAVAESWPHLEFLVA